MLGFLLDVKFRCEQICLLVSNPWNLIWKWALSASWSCHPAALCGWAALVLYSSLNSLASSVLYS